MTHRTKNNSSVEFYRIVGDKPSFIIDFHNHKCFSKTLKDVIRFLKRTFSILGWLFILFWSFSHVLIILINFLPHSLSVLDTYARLCGIVSLLYEFCFPLQLLELKNEFWENKILLEKFLTLPSEEAYITLCSTWAILYFLNHLIYL